MPSSKGICKYCGKEFNQTKWSDGRYSNKMYCSNECCNKYYKQNLSQQNIMAICKYCGKEFKRLPIPSGGYSKSQFCSKNCSELAYKETHLESRKVPKAICKYCGKEFNQTVLPSGSFSGKIYCSTECYNKAQEKPERYLKCKACSKIFKAPYSTLGRQYNVSYCSEECRKSINKYIKTKRICKQCGKEYIQINAQGSREFCSQECKQIYDEQKKIGVCKNCGKTFNQNKRKDGSYSKREFCCNSCSSEYYNINKLYICPACGKKFVRQNINKVCCSENCENSGWELKQDYRTAICSYCGNSFKRYRNPKTGQFSGTPPKYCSSECQTAGQKKIIFENYGENFYAELFKLAQQSREHNESVTNNKFAELLDAYNIKYEREYAIQNYIYDFKLVDYPIVIEINPTYTHNVYGNHYNNFQCDKKFLTYHLDKTNIANKYNLFCVHIWQWDNWNEIIEQQILNFTIPTASKFEIDVSKKVFNPEVYDYKLIDRYNPRKIWSKRESREYIIDNNFNEQEMLNQNYLPVYDCGIEVWSK